MPITISEHPQYKLHIVRLEGRVTFNELCNLGILHRERPRWAAADAFHIVEEGADLSDLSEAKLDTLRAHYAALHKSISFFLVRRSVWVCRDATACRFVEYWLDGRHWRDGQSTDVFLVSDFAQAVMFDDEEIAAVQDDAAHIELARIDDAAPEQVVAA